MPKFLTRLLVYLLIPIGLVLLFLPLNTCRTEELEKDVVFLKISESLVAEKPAKSQIIPPPPEDPTEENVLQFIQNLQKVVSRKESNVATTMNTSGYPVIQKQALAPYSALMEQITDMMRQSSHWYQDVIYAWRMEGVQLEEWTAFKGAFLSNTDIAAFQYGDRIFKEYTKSEYVSMPVEIENLNIACKMAGGIFLFLGLFGWRGMYTSPSKDIQIGKRSGMILWDLIILGIGVLFTWALLDSLLATYFQTSSVLGDVQMGLFMGTFWVIFGNLVMALFVTATDIQTLLINEKGISVTGLFGQKFLDWSEMEDIRLAEYYSARRIGGFFAPRKLAKILEIRGGASKLRIMEPPFSSTKKEILNLLTANAPEELQGSITGISKQWLSVW